MTWNFIPNTITFLSAIPIVFFVAALFLIFGIVATLLVAALAILQAPVYIFVLDFIIIPLIIIFGIVLIVLYEVYDLGPINCAGMPPGVDATICSDVVILMD